MENSYGFLASVYDQLTTDINYEKWAEYIDIHLKKHSIPGNIVLDLACGTGSLTLELTKLGYEMIGVDSSADMLSQGMEKFYDYSDVVEQSPIFLCQSMENLDLYGTIDACVCCLDSINYVTDPKILEQALARVFLFLMPGGLFLFDIKTPETFLEQDGQFSLDETDDVYCVWRTETNTETMLSTHILDLFQRQGKHWIREEEIHHQRLYSTDWIEKTLLNTGFSVVQQFGNLSFDSPSSQEERVFFLAKKNTEMVI